MKNKGISLIMLIISMAVMVILLGMIVAGIGDSVQNARKSSFGNELTTIEQALEIYYVQNGNFPILEENGRYIEYVYNESVLSANTGEEILLNYDYLDEFKQELIKNSDLTEGENVVSDTVFYKLDLGKLGVEETKRGTGKDGDTDIYVMEYPSLNVYYIKGVDVDDVIYFSLANISGLEKTEALQNEVLTQMEAGITVTKENKAWTNVLGINIKAVLESNETIHVKLPVRDEEITLSTTTGENNIIIKSLSGSLSMTETEVENFNNLNDSEKIMNVIKKVDGIETANINVNIANYETVAPTFPLKEDGKTFDFIIESLDGYNRVSFVGQDNLSGIKEVRYVYLTEFGNDLSVKSLISDTSILTDNYMLENGKSAYVSNNGNVEIKLPKDIEAIYITMFDKAGNSVSMQKNVATDTYIGIDAINISNTLKFDIAIKSTSEIDSAKAWISLDGKNYIDEKELTLITNNEYAYNANVEFENTQDKEIYIKVVTYDNSETPNEEVRIKKFDLEELATSLVSSAVPGLTYEENRWYTDKNGDTAIVPAGFRVSTETDEQIINDGLVIIDKNDNEFVWVPCTTDETDTTKVLYAKRVNEYPKLSTITSVSDDTAALPTVNETTIDENAQITKYGGFYIGRYEAGVPANQTTIDGTSADTSNVAGTPTVQQGATVWAYIDYTNANANALSFCNTDNVKSGLVTGTQWDTVMKWIENAGINVASDSTSWGNYKNSTSPANVTGYGKKQTAGYSEYWKAKNIYDLAGNTYEWTGEAYSSYPIARGGFYNDDGKIITSAYRNYYSYSTTARISFRIVLYIM